MDPERVAKAEGLLKEAVSEIELLRKNFQKPADENVRMQMFGNQHTLLSLLKIQALTLEQKIKDLEDNVESLK